jgi:site-specific DNA-cytosine methylase
MKVLVACEFSGVVREAFAAMGHDAWSCDLLPSEISGQHIQGDVFDWLALHAKEFDLMLAHPPCTHLCSSGARWWSRNPLAQVNAIDFVRFLMEVDVPRICVENPVGVLSRAIRKPDQIIQPWQFGHGETKATCLWLKNLPLLQPTNMVEGRSDRIHKLPQSKNRWRERSRTYIGIAEAMANQWGVISARAGDREGESR